jgi:hydrogenase-4 component F
MSMLSQGIEGLAVALSIVMFVAARTQTAAALCALQGAIVSLVVALHFAWLAVIPLALVAAILPVYQFFPAHPDRVPRGSLFVGGTLALLALTFPGKHLALAVLLLGAALTVTRRSAAMQIFGLLSLQNGIILAATTNPVATVGTAVAMLPTIPALAFLGLWLNVTRRGASVLAAWPTNTWFDAIACSVVLALACALPLLVPMEWAAVRVDAFVATIIPLLAIVATAASWAPRLRASSAGPAGARFILIVSATLAVLVEDPLRSWLALVIATMAAALSALPRGAEAWRRSRLGSLGLGIALSGTIVPVGVDVWAPVCTVVGLGTVACLAPELALASVAIIVRHLHPLSEHAPVHALLMAAGLAGIAVTGGATLLCGKSIPLASFIGLGQAGVALFAFGLGIPAANVAALVNLILLSLTQSGLLLAGEGSLAQLVAAAGLAGVPPFGIFPALALVIAATASRLPWMLLPFAAALGLLVWSTLAQLPALPVARSLPRRPYAWAPLLLALLVGFAMPEPVFAWLQSAAAGVL